jgi:hypothetical protein
MTSLFVNADAIRFPRTCPHCGRKAEGTYAVAAARGLDAYLGGYTMPPLLDVPVCREAFDRRRAAGLWALVAILVALLLAVAAAVMLAWRGAWVPAALSALVAAALALGGRTGWDAALLDRVILRMHARSVSSTRMRLGFADGRYAAGWKKLDRSASTQA